MNARDAQNLIEKLNSLPLQRQAEVEDFVDFLRSREDDQRLVTAAARASEPGFAVVWETRTIPSMTAYNFGDVILVPFPFTDQSQSKQRPAVVVSSLRYHAEPASSYVALSCGSTPMYRRLGANYSATSSL